MEVGREAEIWEGMLGVLCCSECGSSVGGKVLMGRDGREGAEEVKVDESWSGGLSVVEGCFLVGRAGIMGTGPCSGICWNGCSSLGGNSGMTGSTVSISVIAEC
jgi:hypothetical protein